MVIKWSPFVRQSITVKIFFSYLGSYTKKKDEEELNLLYCECLHYLKVFGQNIHTKMSGKQLMKSTLRHRIRKAILLSKK